MIACLGFPDLQEFAGQWHAGPTGVVLTGSYRFIWPFRIFGLLWLNGVIFGILATFFFTLKTVLECDPTGCRGEQSFSHLIPALIMLGGVCTTLVFGSVIIFFFRFVGARDQVNLRKELEARLHQLGCVNDQE